MTYIVQNKKYMIKDIINYALKSNADFDFGITKCDKLGVIGTYHFSIKKDDIIEICSQEYNTYKVKAEDVNGKVIIFMLPFEYIHNFTKFETINLEEYYKDKIINYLNALKYHDYGLVEVYTWKDSRKKEVEIDSYQVVNLRTNKILSEGSLEFISNDMDYYRESRFRIESLRFLHQHNLLEHFIHM